MQAVILAAGRGARLSPLTLRRTKACLPLAGAPMIGRVIENLLPAGVEEFVLVVHPWDAGMKAGQLLPPGCSARLRMVVQTERHGAAHALLQAAPFIRDDFLLSACDNLVTAADLARMLAAWRELPGVSAVFSLLRVPPEQFAHSGAVTLQGEWVTSIIEKPGAGYSASDLASLPLYLLPLSFLDLLKDLRPSVRGELELQPAMQAMIEQGGGVRGVIFSSRHTLTRPVDLLALNRQFLTRQLDPIACHSPLDPSIALVPPVWVDPGVLVEPGAVLGPYVILERGAHLGAGVRLEHAIALRGARLPAHFKGKNIIAYEDGVLDLPA